MEDFLTLDQKQEELVYSKRGSVNRLVLGVMLKFFELNGRHLTSRESPPLDLLDCVASQLDVNTSLFADFDWESITAKRFRRDIRDFFGYRRATKKDEESLIHWLMENHVGQNLNHQQHLEHSYDFFRKKKVQPFSPAKMERHISSACYRFEKNFFNRIATNLSMGAKKRLDDLVKGGESFFDAIKRDVVNAKDIPFGIQKLEFLRRIGLSKNLFQTVSRKFLYRHYTRVVAEFSSHMQKYAKESKYGRLGIFCHYRAEQLTDNLVDLLFKGLKRIRNSAEVHVSKEGVKDIKKVDGKYGIL